MRRLLMVAGGVTAVCVAAAAWRRNRRFGTQFVNRIVNPALLRRHLAGSGRSEIGALEHVGRKTRTLRRTPVHPEPTADGFRIIVPLGSESQWARNVLAAGHCRLQVHDTTYELDEPRLISPDQVAGMPWLLRRLETALGFRYLVLHRFVAGPALADAGAGPGTRPRRRVATSVARPRAHSCSGR